MKTPGYDGEGFFSFFALLFPFFERNARPASWEPPGESPPVRFPVGSVLERHTKNAK